MNRKLEKSLRQSNKKKEDKVILLSGELGIPLNGQKLVEVPNRQGFVFVRLKNNTSELIQAYNTAVSPIYGLPVLVSRSVGVYKVVGRNVDRYTNQWGQAPYLPKHGAQHSFNPDINIGGDIVWVYSSQFMPLLAYPSGSNGSPQLSVSPYFIRDMNGAWKYVGNTGTPDTTPYNPTTGSRAVMGLVYLDTVSGNPQLLINSGTYIDASLTGSNQIVDYIPRVTNPNWIPLAGIRLVSGSTQLSWNNVYDVRPFLQVFPTGSSSGGGGGGGNSSGLGVMTWDEGVPLGTGTVLNFVGAGVTATISGTVVNVNVPSSGGGTATGSVTIWESGVSKGSPAILDLRNNLSATASGTVISLDAMPGLYDVTHFGGVGDGITDDTAAINRAISAIPVGGGVLYFPPGLNFRTTGSHSIANPVTIMGMGFGNYVGTGSVSCVSCYSPTANLFLITSAKAQIRDIALLNTATSTPSNGSAVSTQGSGLAQRVDFENISVKGFYNNIDVQVGADWYMHGCYITGPVNYGIKIRNTVNTDAGDWSISDCSFLAINQDSQAAIRIESSGGGKIINTKINGNPFKFVNGIDLAPAGSTTSILLVSNSSIENVSGNGINVNTSISYDYLIFNGIEFALYGNSTGNAIKVNASSSGLVNSVVIGNCIFAGGTSSCAISLTNVVNGHITGNINRSFGSLLCQATCTNIVTDSVISILDEGIYQGDVSAINFVGAGVTATASSSTGTVTIAGGGGTPSQGVVVYNNGNYFASGTQISFDNNLYLGLSGTIIHVSSPVTTYQRTERPIPINSVTGTMWKVPDNVYASGSLGVFYNGLIQYKGRDYEELLYSSGTYHLLFTPTTGSVHMVSYGVPCISQPFSGATGTNTMVDSLGSLLVDSNGTQLVDSNG